MSSETSTEPVNRHRADWISIAVFFLSLATFLIILLPHSSKPGSSTTTTVSTVQVVQGTHGVTQRTQTTQKTTNTVVPPIWLSLLGKQQTAFLIISISILAAYFLAAISQRVMLGKYAITIGPFSVPDITPEQVENAIRPVLPEAAESIREANPEPVAVDAAVTRSQEGVGSAPGGTPIWTTIGDPNLALAGWRIDIERELKRISEQSGLPAREQRNARMMISTLAKDGAITNNFANSLQDLLTMANQGVHGAKVDIGVLLILRTDGLTLLNYLRSIGRRTAELSLHQKGTAQHG
jgi:hypothetical protein